MSGLFDPVAEAPRSLGRYQLLAKLGSGGQADVYLAAAVGTLGIDKLVVIKQARPGIAADDARLGIFLDEARLTLRLNHPNIVHTYEIGEDGGACFIAMEYVEGHSLEELFRDPRARGFAAAIWLRVIADALAGLGHAHGLRDYDGTPLEVVHRDISPHNLLVSYDGVAKLLDFGLARPTDDQMLATGAELTRAGTVLGTPRYMAPEQVVGDVIDARTDLFAAGAILFEMLAGRHPSRSDDARGTLTRHLSTHDAPAVRPESSAALARAALAANR